MSDTLVEQTLSGLIRVHVALFEHGIDLLFAVAHDLLQVLHYLLGTRRNLHRRTMTAAPSAAARGGAHDAHPACASASAARVRPQGAGLGPAVGLTEGGAERRPGIAGTAGEEGEGQWRMAMAGAGIETVGEREDEGAEELNHKGLEGREAFAAVGVKP